MAWSRAGWVRSTVRLENGLGIDGSSLPRAPVKARMAQRTRAPTITHPERDRGRMTTSLSSRFRWSMRLFSHPQTGLRYAEAAAAASSAWRTQAAMPRPR